MKLNGVITTVAKYKAEILGDDTVVFCEESHKIIILNKTAALILSEIENAMIANTSISTEDLTCSLMDKCGISMSELNRINIDVVEAINIMIEASLLIQ